MKHIFTFFILLTLCSCGSNAPQVDTTDYLTSTAKPESTLSRTDRMRKKMADYCADHSETGIMVYFGVYNREYGPYNRPEHGAFENVNFAKDNDGNNVAETSVTVMNSACDYNISPKYGEINIVGISFKLDAEDNIVGHEYYVSFIKNRHETFYWTTDETGYPLEDLIK